MNDQLKAHVSLFIAALIFGGNYVLSKNLMPEYFSPYQIMFLRMAGASLIFTILQKIICPEKVEKKDILKFALYSLSGIALNQMLFYIGLEKTTATNAAFIHLTSPVIVLIFASLIIGERITPLKAIGIVLGIGGAMLLVLNKKELSFASDTLIGHLLIFLNIVFYSLYMVLVKPWMQKYKPLTVTKWILISGTIYIIPFTSSSMVHLNWNHLNGFSWFSILYIVLLTTVVAYLLTTYALKHVNASVVGFYMYLQPIFATFLALLIGTEVFSYEKLISAVIIFTGVYLVSKKNEASN